LIRIPPFRTPHHTASDIALVGGGRIPSVGEISLAHNGVLFLDEFSEFQRSALQTLRQPMEDQVVSISRASGNMRYPCDFMLIAATNPCQCGYFFDEEIRCRCTPGDIARYRKTLSGPVIDRIDMEIYVPRVPYEKLMSGTYSENSISVRRRVEHARIIQRERFRGAKTRFNSRMTSHEVKKFCRTDADAMKLFESAVSRLQLSSRSVFRMMKVARTIADMDNSPIVSAVHAGEALSYKNMSGRYS
jgi:magnesium chelatase family protein